MEFNRPHSSTTRAPTASHQTDAEQALWARLRDRQLCGAKFRRQHPIGPFVADFCCPQGKLIVELDGGQHAARVAADQKRARFLQEQGYRVLCFWNHDVLGNTEAVLERIVEALSYPHPCPLPGSLEGRGGRKTPEQFRNKVGM